MRSMRFLRLSLRQLLTLSVTLGALVALVLALQLGGGGRAVAQTAGDADCNASVDSIDAVLVLQFDAGLISSVPCPEDADVNRDGNVDSLDATLMLQFDASLITSLPPSFTITVSGSVIFDTGGPVAGASVAVSAFDGRPPGSEDAEVGALQGSAGSTTTDSAGAFTVQIGPAPLPARVLVEVSYQADSMPGVQSAQWDDAQSATFDAGTIVLPDASTAEMSLADGAAQSADGSLLVEGLTSGVASVFGRSYDPDADTDAFPGEFAEGGAIPLNSAAFAWLEGLDAAGNPVDTLSQAATIRSQIDPAQWPDLEDLTVGTDRIEIPIFTYNEDENVWEDHGTGWLEDDQGTILPEDAQPTILDGSFPGQLFAAFTTTHLSWMNVDYAFIGPWTLSRLDRDQRNNDCLYKALQLAKTIASSQQGHTAYARVNQAGADLDSELSDGNGPELKNVDLAGEYGVYKGDSGGSESQFEIDNSIWDGCGAGATEAQKKNTILIMAVTILHETAHWKDDVKKHPDDDTDTDGEEGNKLEQDLFGGIITGGAAGLKRDGSAVDDATRDGWLNPDSWPAPAAGGGGATRQAAGALADALEVTISLPQDTFELGADIPMEVQYRNVSGASIQVLNRVVLEGWPLYFTIVNQATGERVKYLGPEFKLRLEDTDFTSLAPDRTLVQTVNLVRDPATSAPHYQLLRSGTFDVTAVYETFRGVSESTSNTVTMTLNPGGSISGTISDAETGNPIADATVRVTEGGDLLDTATSGADGSYSIPELPAGTYTLEARAPGFLRSTRENVQVTTGQTTTANFSLSPLLVSGELRLVLTWGLNPRDLDSHLWLPEAVEYHIYFSRRGGLSPCPFAVLDTDDTSSFGPETITVAQRVAGTYHYAVHQYAGSGDLTTSEAQVQVFDSTGLLATFSPPAAGEGRWWHVLSFDGSTGAITEVGTIGADPAPYPDTAQGCVEAFAARVGGGGQGPAGVAASGWAARMRAFL